MVLKFESDTGLSLGKSPAPLEQKDVSTGDLTKAAFSTSNSVGSAVAQGLDQVNADEYFGRNDARNNTPQELPGDFNPFTEAVKHGYNETELDSLIQAGPKTKEDFQDFDFSLQRQRADKETLEQGGTAGVVAQLAAGVLDPTIMLEGASAVKAAKGISIGARMVSTGRKGGMALAEGIANASIAGMEGVGMQEAALQATQTTRSPQESLLNVGAAGVIAPLLIGGPTVVAHLWGGKIARYAETMKMRGTDIEKVGNKFADEVGDVSDLVKMQDHMDDAMNAPRNDLSAAAVEMPTLEDETLQNAFGVETLSKNFTPVLRMAQSPSLATRRLGGMIAENSMQLNKIRGGKFAQDIAVERLTKNTLQDAEITIGANRKAYAEYLKENDVTGLRKINAIAGREKGVMTYDQFKEQVSTALRTNDDHADLSVKKAVQGSRAYLEKILQRGKDAGVFPEWMSTVRQTDSAGDAVRSYLPRNYNREKIKREEGNFKEIIRPQAERAARAAVNDIHQVHKTKLERLDGQVQRLETDNAKMGDTLKNDSGKGGGVDVLKIEKMADIDLAQAQQRLASLTDENFIKTRNLENINPEAVAQSRYAEVLRDYPDPDLAPDDIKGIVEKYHLQNLMNDAHYVLQKPPAKPDSLIDSIVKRGGLQDEGGELKALGIENRSRVGIVNNRSFTQGARKRGMLADEALTHAMDDGFLPAGSDIRDLMDALDQHFRHDQPTYRADDLETVRDLQNIADTKETLTQFGVDNPRQFIRDVYEAAKTERKGARADVKAAKERQKLSKDVADQVRTDLKEKVMPRLSELYDYRKYFKQKLTSQIARNDKRIAELTERTKSLDTEFSSRLRNEFDMDNGMSDYVDDIVNTITDHVTGRTSARIPGNIPMAERGPLKGRQWAIDDLTIEGYLNNDVDDLLAGYARTAGVDVELAHKFGTLDVEKVIAEHINPDYDDLRQAILKDSKLKPDEREAKLSNLATFQERDKRDFRGMWDIMRGTYKQDTTDPDKWFSRGAQAIRTVNMMRMLGGRVLSSLTDLAMPVFVHGMKRYYGEYLPSLVTNLKGIKLQVADARAAGLAIEHITASVLTSISEMGDPYAKHTMLERFIQNSGRSFNKINGGAFWDNTIQKISSSISQTRMLQAIEAANKGGIQKTEAEYLAFLGIDKVMQDRIYEQYKATRPIYGSSESASVKIAGLDRWTDSEAVRVYRAALGKDVDRQILQVGKGDVPLFMQTELGKTLTQFRSFSMAAHSKLLIAGLQRRDAGAISGFGHLVAMGLLVDYLKSVESGRDMKTGAGDLIMNGLDRSGALTLLFEVANTADKMNIGPRRVLGISESSRFASRSAIDAVLGPTAGFLGDTAQTIGAAAGSTPMSSADIHKMRRLMIGNNISYLRPLFDKMEQAYGSSQKGD